MSEELQTLNLQNLKDAIRLMNESTHGTSLECHLDMFSFMSLWQYWNFSPRHSLIRYVEGEPAALILTCTDAQTHEAYTFYWGTIPKFRSRRISMPLFDLCCKRLLDDGYTMLHGISSPDRPVRRYRFIQALPARRLVDFGVESFNLPEADKAFEVRPCDVGHLSQINLPCEPLHWCQRPAFLRSATSFVQFIGAFAGNALSAYAVVHPQPTSTTIVDLRSLDGSDSAGFELLRWISSTTYRAPFTAIFVFEPSYSYSLLSKAGFTILRHFYTLSRDLTATSSAGTRDVSDTHPPAI